MDQFHLERSDVSASGPWNEDCGWFDTTDNDEYFDTNLVDDTDYWYRLTTYDKAGNFDYSSVEYTHYNAPS